MKRLRAIYDKPKFKKSALVLADAFKEGRIDRKAKKTEYKRLKTNYKATKANAKKTLMEGRVAAMNPNRRQTSTGYMITN